MHLVVQRPEPVEVPQWDPEPHLFNSTEVFDAMWRESVGAAPPATGDAATVLPVVAATASTAAAGGAAAVLPAAEAAAAPVSTPDSAAGGPVSVAAATE